MAKSDRINWARLMRLGLVEMRMRPAAFWALTPAELMFLATGGGEAAPRMDRAGLDALLTRYPDKETTDG